VHGIAAKIPEKVRVFFQDQRLDAGASQQISEHHPGGTTADDAAFCVNGTPGRLRSGSSQIHDAALACLAAVTLYPDNSVT
jgi:hypothetical protein